MEKIQVTKEQDQIIKEVFSLSREEIVELATMALIQKGEALKGRKFKSSLAGYFPQLVVLTVEYEKELTKEVKKLLKQEAKKREKFLKWAETITLQQVFDEMYETIPSGKNLITRLRHSVYVIYDDGVGNSDILKRVKLTDLVSYTPNDLIKFSGIGPKVLVVFDEYLQSKGGSLAK